MTHAHHTVTALNNESSFKGSSFRIHRPRRCSVRNRRKSKADFDQEMVDQVIHEAERTSTNQAALVQESMWEDPGEVLKSLYDSVEARAQRRRHYLALFCFVVYVFLYLAVLALQKDAGGQYLLTSSMSEDLVPRDVNDLPRATFYKDTAIYDWLEGIMQKHWEELKCGDGVCNHPLEYRSFGRFGCQADCGAHNSTFVRFVLMANLKSDAALSEVTFNLCNREEQESPGKPLCWYEEDQRFQSVHETVAHNVLLPDGQWELRIRNIAGSNGGVIAGVSVAGDSLRAQPSADAQSPGPDAQPSSGDDPSNSHGRRILSILGDSQRLEQKRVHQLKHLLMAPDEHVGSVPGAVEARVLSEVENFFDSAQGAVDGATHWTHWQYERHHVLEQYDLHQYVLWTYEECHDGVLQAMDMIRNSSLQCHLDWRPASCCAFLSEVLHHECSCTDQLELLEAVGVDTNAVETCAAIEDIPLVSGKLCPITSPVEWSPTSKEEVNTVACHHIVYDLAQSASFGSLCAGDGNKTRCCPLLNNFEKYNCECSDSFMKLDHTTQMTYEKLFVECALDVQEHDDGQCDGRVAPVHIASSPSFAREYNAWQTRKAAMHYIHLEADMLLNDDWLRHSQKNRVLLASEVSCPEVGHEPADCRTHLRHMLANCESKSEDHTVKCNAVCSAYLCDQQMSALCADTSMEWTSYAGDVFTVTYFQAWSSYKGVYEHQGCAACEAVDEECHLVSMETKDRLQYCTLQPESPCFWYGEGDQKVSKAFDQLEAYFMDVGEDIVCAVSKGIRTKYGSILNVSCDHMIEEFRTTDELFNIKCREDHHVGPCEIHADCGLGEFCGLVETEYGNAVCIDCIECCNPPNGNGQFWGSEPGCGHCVCSECSPGCTLSMRTNSLCDKACFTETCGWDNFNCYNELANYEVRCPSEPGKFWEPVLYHSAEVEYALCCGLHDKFDSSVAFDIWSHNDALHHEDYDLVPDSKQIDGLEGLRRFVTNKNRVLVGMLLVLERYDKDGRCAAVDDYHELYPHCLGEPLSAPYGIDPMFQFGTDLFVEAVAERQSEYYDPSDVNEAGVPYGFHHHRIAGFERHPGYPIVFDVNLLPERALDMLTYMKEGHYLDFESQRLTVQLLTFNGNNGMFGNTVVTMEFLLHGGVKITHAVSGLVLELYLTPLHYLRACFELVFAACYIFTVYCFIIDFSSHYKETRSALSYFTSGVSNVVEFVSLIVGASNIIQWIDIVVVSSGMEIQDRFDVYEDLQGEANWLKLANDGQGLRDAAAQFNNITTLRLRWDYYMFFNAFNLTLMVVRVLNIMDFHPDIGLITRTLTKAVHDLANFCVVASLLVTVYACMGHIFLGDQILAMSTIQKSFSTCLYFMIGDFLSSDVWATNMNLFSSITLALWFWSYVTVVFIILLSALLAIIVSSMDQLKQDDVLREKTNLFVETGHILFYCVDAVRRGFKKRMTESSVRRKIKEMIDALPVDVLEIEAGRQDACDPAVKAIPIGSTTLQQKQLEQLLASLAESYVSACRGSFFDSHQMYIDGKPGPPSDVSNEITGELNVEHVTHFDIQTKEMSSVLFRSLAKPQKDVLDEIKDWQSSKAKEEAWKADVLALLKTIQVQTTGTHFQSEPTQHENQTLSVAVARTYQSNSGNVVPSTDRSCSTHAKVPAISPPAASCDVGNASGQPDVRMRMPRKPGKLSLDLEAYRKRTSEDRL
mmetsp:Transcript_46712/g.86973  ORF Transcript_46712/g.86973 Transcript_46712/m.86973 type:complete len:1710 (+) Transcript_46712:432-5561(+)